jgi:predicted glutamine amidotransferase
MCRLFYALRQPDVAVYLFQFMQQSNHIQKNTPLIEPASSCDELVHLDGYGVAGLHGGGKKWIVHKHPTPPFRDTQLHYIIDKMSKNPLVIAHLRNAQHPESADVHYDNTHPFSFNFRNAIFMHNGIIEGHGTDPSVRTRIYSSISPRLRRHIKGQTDSEALFYLLISHIQQLEDRDDADDHVSRRVLLRDAIENCFFNLANITDFTANIIYSEPDFSIVTRFAKNPRSAAPSLYINRTGGPLFLSSEPLFPDFQLVRQNTYFVINHATNEYTIHSFP